ncbi:MAG: M23 family metallopeptidase [Caldimonas sp.]
MTAGARSADDAARSTRLDAMCSRAGSTPPRSWVSRSILPVALIALLQATVPARAAPADPDEPVPIRPLAIPVDGVERSALRDTYEAGRGFRRHEAIDIPAPRGTPVFAADDGRLVKLFSSAPGGLTVYQFDREDRVAYYYAHLDRYASGLREGIPLRRCDLIGYVGTTGNAPPDAPHLHFAIIRLGNERQWWRGTPINPYAWLHDDADASGSASAVRPADTIRRCR